MYYTLHEADISKLVDMADSKMKELYGVATGPEIYDIFILFYNRKKKDTVDYGGRA